jgi:hypothetical protein
MPIFVLAYHRRPGYTPTPQTQAAWHAWFAGMGDQLADMGKPVIAQTALGDCSPDRTELGGYSLIQADDLAAAAALAKGRRRGRRAGRGPGGRGRGHLIPLLREAGREALGTLSRGLLALAGVTLVPFSL